MSFTNPDNLDTLRRASKLIGHYLGTDKDGRSMSEVVTDMVADLLIYAYLEEEEIVRGDIEHIVSSAVMHYEYETKRTD